MFWFYKTFGRLLFQQGLLLACENLIFALDKCNFTTQKRNKIKILLDILLIIY